MEQLNHISSTLANSTLNTRVLNITTSKGQLVSADIKSTDFHLVGMMACILCIGIVVAVFGNGFVLVVIRLSRKLRHVANYFIISRCISDLLVALLSMPFWISYLLTGWPNRKSGAIYSIWICLDIFYGTWSIISLAMISIERYICIVYPNKHEGFVTKKRVRLAVSFALAYSAFTSCLGYLRISLNLSMVSAGIFVFACVIPVHMKMFTYRKIYKEARRQRQITIQEEKIRRRLCQEQYIVTSNSCIVQSLSGNKRKL